MPQLSLFGKGVGRAVGGMSRPVRHVAPRALPRATMFPTGRATQMSLPGVSGVGRVRSTARFGSPAQRAAYVRGTAGAGKQSWAQRGLAQVRKHPYLAAGAGAVVLASAAGNRSSGSTGLQPHSSGGSTLYGGY